MGDELPMLLVLFVLWLNFRKNVDLVCVYCLWAMMFFFLYRDFWEHHYVLFLPIFAIMTATGRIKQWILIVTYALTQTPTLFGALNTPEIASYLEGLKFSRTISFLEVFNYLYFLIKPLGAMGLFYVIVRKALKSSDSTVQF